MGEADGVVRLTIPVTAKGGGQCSFELQPRGPTKILCLRYATDQTTELAHQVTAAIRAATPSFRSWKTPSPVTTRSYGGTAAARPFNSVILPEWHR